MKKHVLFLMISTFLFSCEKKEVIPIVEPIDPTKTVNILQDGASFETIFEIAIPLQSVNAAPPSIDIADFTVEKNNNFNIVYSISQPSQQSVLTGFTRFSKNLITQEVIPLPQYANDLKGLSPAQIQLDGLGLGMTKFKPYSNFFNYAVIRNGSFNFKNSISFQGDQKATIASFNPIGIADLAYYYPVSNTGAASKNNAFGYITLGTPSPSYLTSVCNPYDISFYNNSPFPIYACLFEPRVFNGQGTSKSFFIRSDSVIVNELNIDTKQQTFLTGFKWDNVIPSVSNGFETLRHYSEDGSILCILFFNRSLNKYYSFSYNFTTKILTKGLEDTRLDYSAEGSDLDTDEFGNIYYSGYADNGANKIAVSIYKKSIDGSTSLVGTNNFLKFGTIVQLKHLFGKVYVAVNGKITGTSSYQMTVVRQK